MAGDNNHHRHSAAFVHLAVITVLGACGLLGMVGILVLAGLGREVPQAAVAIVASCFGSLGSILVNPPRVHDGPAGHSKT